MSAKERSDEKKHAWPWTTRQKRRSVGKRLARKQTRKATRNI
jgi:hypothetical protein